MWARVCGALAGIWLMAAPSVLGYGGAGRVSDLIAGPLAVSAAVIAMSQVTRPIRWVTLPLGAWVVVAPWLLGAPAPARVSGLLVSCSAGWRWSGGRCASGSAAAGQRSGGVKRRD